MYEVVVTGVFAAAHQLRLPDGSLEPLHGHNWHVRATYAGSGLDEMGVLVDFTRLRPALQAVLGELNDTFLNELPAFEEINPSAENVAGLIAERLTRADVGGHPSAQLAEVEVEEEPGCFARVKPHRPA